MVWDSVRADHVGTSGLSIRDTTPCLNRMGAEGIIFRHARAPSNWTLPSHASMFTGKSPLEHGCHFEHRFLVDEATTIAEVLAKQGYATAGFSANGNVGQTFNLAQGFDTFSEVWTDPQVAAGANVGDVLMKQVDDWLASTIHRPRFLFINLMDAHLPYDPKPGFEDRYGEGGGRLDRKLLDSPEFFDRVLAGDIQLESRFLRALDARYDGAIRGLDERLTELRERLRVYGMLNETAFVVTSDHGENLGEHGMVDHHGGLQETLLRVPLVVSGAGIPTADPVDQPVSTTDLFRWFQAISQRSFSANVGRSPVISQRMRPTVILDRLQANYPGFDRSRIGRRATSLVESGSSFKVVREEGLPDRLVLITRRPSDEDYWATAAGPIAELSRTLDDELARRHREPEVFAPSVPTLIADEQIEELRRRGYVGSDVFGGSVSIHAQEHLNRGNRAFNASEFELAESEYDAARTLAPDFVDAWFNRAVVVEKLRPTAAVAAWRAYLEVAIRTPEVDETSIRQAQERILSLEGEGE